MSGDSSSRGVRQGAVLPDAAGDYLDVVMSARWTFDEMCREKDRRLTEDLQTLGPCPAWWRRCSRRLYDRSVRRLEKAHDSDLRAMLAAQDPRIRAIMAHLTGRPEAQ